MHRNTLAILAVLLFGVVPKSLAQTSVTNPMESPLGIAMARDGSGTAWLPDASPMYAWHRMAGSWMLMFHDNAFVHYVREGSARGSKQFGSTNWAMGMARRTLAGGNLTLRAMMSIEPATVGRCGYPDLLATGERCNGQPLHDRQHPHDLFMEVALAYDRAVTSNLAIQVYGGPVGEPALGPVAFPHRPSALNNPFAPIAHHWLDATHIAFGVVTGGLYGRRWKLEGSLFNGREPDEFRYGIDLNSLNSYSGRLWILPTEHWAVQASVGRLNEAERDAAGGPPLNVTRSTASITYARSSEARSVAAMVAWGANIEEGKATHALIGEGNLTLGEKNALFARAELNGKTGHDLVLSPASAILQEQTFTLAKVALGYSRSLGKVLGFTPGIGASLSLSIMPADLEPYYGSTAAAGFAIMASLRPPKMPMGM